MSTSARPDPATGSSTPVEPVEGGRWALNPATTLRWRELDGQWLVFDGGSGQTHLLDPLTAAALSFFESGPQDLASLSAALGASVPASSASTVTDGVHSAIAGLLRIGVLELAAA